jgi:hypothetical protein
MNRQCFCSKFLLLPIICSRITGKNIPGVLYESLLYIKITVYSTVGLPAAIVWVRNLVCHIMGITQAEDVENRVLRKMRK